MGGYGYGVVQSLSSFAVDFWVVLSDNALFSGVLLLPGIREQRGGSKVLQECFIYCQYAN